MNDDIEGCKSLGKDMKNQFKLKINNLKKNIRKIRI